MILVGFQPNVISYNAAISACEKAEQFELALELLQECGSVACNQMWSATVRPSVLARNLRSSSWH